MVKSKNIFSPQNYVYAVTGKCYVMDYDDIVDDIHRLLKQNNAESDESPLWDYPLDEIDHIVENNINVVLVDVSGFGDDNEWNVEYRWFEVPDSFVDGEQM